MSNSELQSNCNVNMQCAESFIGILNQEWNEATGVLFHAQVCLIVFNESVPDKDYSSDLLERYEIPSEDEQFSFLSLQ